MDAALDDTAILYNYDLVCFHDGRQSVRNNDRCPSGESDLQGLLYLSFGFGLQVCGSFIQDDNVWRFQQQSRNGETLLSPPENR